MTRKYLYILLIVALISTLGLIVVKRKQTQNLEGAKNENTKETPEVINDQRKYSYPINDFESRISKKPFGIYVTPQNSPVQPEHFTGYHTGVDVEYDDVAGDIPVQVIADGKVIVSRTATGYGGVIIVQHNIEGRTFNTLYGHIRPSTLPGVGKELKRDEQIGILGNPFSIETGGERKHLHFAVLKDSNQDLRGYVQNREELSGWYEPTQFLKA